MPEYDEKGRLTRKGAEQVIAAGGTVHHNNTFYGPGSQLPSEAEFAKGDPKAEAAARERLLAQRKALDAELAALDDSAKQQQAADRAAAKTAGATPPAASGK